MLRHQFRKFVAFYIQLCTACQRSVYCEFESQRSSLVDCIFETRRRQTVFHRLFVPRGEWVSVHTDSA